MRALVSTLAVCAALATASPASAWEADTTHAGLTEQAALASHLHQRLRDALGIERGLFAALIVPPADAPELFEVLRLLNPTHGHVPDERGRLLALGWLAAGAVVADVPPAHAAHHFFDPATGRGLSPATLDGLARSLRHRLRTRVASERLVRSGMPATEWITHADNPMGLAGFLDQYAKGVRARTPAERARHVAGALLAAGAILHVLQDMGSPSHVRDDLAAHLDRVGPSQLDVGSRLERVAALAFGRLGVTPPARVVQASSLLAFFTAGDGSGLADRTARRFFSAYTLPRPVRIKPGASVGALAETIAARLARPEPRPAGALDLEAARQAGGARLTSDDGVCLASYALRQSTLSWSIDDECAAEQVAVLLPEITAYSAGLLDWLFRGTIEVARSDAGLSLSAAGAEFGAGTVEVFWEDSRGVRAPLGGPVTVAGAASGQALAITARPPAEAQAVAALFQGVDQSGEPLVAAGYLPLAAPARR